MKTMTVLCVLLGVTGFVMSMGNLLIFLLMFEMVNLLIFMLLLISFAGIVEGFVIFFFLVVAVVESILGLVLFMKYILVWGSGNMKLLTMIKF